MITKTGARRFADSSRRDIELVLLGAVMISATPEQVLERVPTSHLSIEFQKLFEAVSTSKKRKIMDPCIAEWLASRTVVLEKGDDLVSAVVRRMVQEAEMRTIEAQGFLLSQLMKNGTTVEVVSLMKRILIELGEMAPGPEKQ